MPGCARATAASACPTTCRARASVPLMAPLSTTAAISWVKTLSQDAVKWSEISFRNPPVQQKEQKDKFYFSSLLDSNTGLRFQNEGLSYSGNTGFRSGVKRDRRHPGLQASLCFSTPSMVTKIQRNGEQGMMVSRAMLSHHGSSGDKPISRVLPMPVVM